MATVGPGRLPTFDDVRAAAIRIAGHPRLTPLLADTPLDARTSGRILLKLETLQHTGSFKFRGAYNRLAQLDAAGRHAGVVAFSSGNHAQGVAAAARLLGIPATIVMPADAPRVCTATVSISTAAETCTSWTGQRTTTMVGRYVRTASGARACRASREATGDRGGGSRDCERLFGGRGFDED